MSENPETTTEGAEKPKRGRKPNVVGKAAVDFEKARKRLERAKARAAKVQAVNDELAAAQAEYDNAENAYRVAFESSFGTSAE